jgi:hypothetical protein
LAHQLVIHGDILTIHRITTITTPAIGVIRIITDLIIRMDMVITMDIMMAITVADTTQTTHTEVPVTLQEQV